ncbi:MAG: alpha-glucan family phosphorylase [Phycisphaerales bacterium]|nr:alpha-glucan family phosphorylase [Phycisphaerales bacterium]
MSDLTRESAARAADLRQSLAAIARNLAWTWIPEMRVPFEMLNAAAYESSNHSVAEVLSAATDLELLEHYGDREFMHALARAEIARDEEMARPSWWRSQFPAAPAPLRIAYLCSEYALHESMPQYAGGLGVLAGDHLKSASELGVPLCAVGLFYTHGYYRQEISVEGVTRVSYPNFEPQRWPLEDTGCSVACPIGRRRVKARIWLAQVGRVPLYLLDANLRANRSEDRELTMGLYKGEPSLRLRQQVLLGVGGVMALQAVGESPTVFHLNEGHAAFAPLQRVAQLVEAGAQPAAAMERVRSSTVFTTHTPVPAGHDRYGVREAVVQLKRVLRSACISPRAFAQMGGEDGVTDAQGGGAAQAGSEATSSCTSAKKPSSICMTALALRLSSRANGVSALHGEVSRKMWQSIRHLDGAPIPIGHVTNGVHVRTWISSQAERFWHEHASIDLREPDPARQGWERAAQVPHAEFWGLRQSHRVRLVHFVRERLVRQSMRRGESELGAFAALQALSTDALTIGFARRFATYKRAGLIFSDIDRLAKLLGNPQRPLQIIFAGKAHPRDEGAQRLAQQVFLMQRDPRMNGRVALIEEYDMHVGRMLTSGCDVWLNNPLRPYEASGTSGMKPPLHGGINCSVLDGWWPEAADGNNGWSLPLAPDELSADEHDAASLYQLLEEHLVPTFYDRGADGLPHRWIEMALASAATIAPVFNTHRMIGDYLREAYLTPTEKQP